MAAVTPQNEGAVATRMLEDNTAHPVALPKVKLFPPEYKVLLLLLRCRVACNSLLSPSELKNALVSAMFYFWRKHWSTPQSLCEKTHITFLRPCL